MEALENFFNSPRNIWFALAAAVVIVLPFLLQAPLRRYLDARRIKRAVHSLGAKVAPDVTIPDGLDGHAYIDYLVLTPNHLLVVLVKRYPGAIFGAEGIDLWAQVMSSGSYKFANPLSELQDIIAVLRGRLPNTPVEGAVLFDQDSVFPKGKPARVLHVPDIDTKQTVPIETVPHKLQQAWVKVCP